MIDKVFSILSENNIDFFTGVPDSYLNGFCKYLIDYFDYEHNVIAANEGNAIAIAAGYYFSTGKIPLVYMQNSGLGNALNPLVSLASKNVYSVPMLLLVGWRGKPGTKDALREQHTLQGKITEDLLKIMEIPYRVLCKDNITNDFIWAINNITNINAPVALIVPEGVLSEKKSNIYEESDYPLSREEAIKAILEVFPKNAIFVATTGRASRELYCLRELRSEDHSNDFLNIGAMGHASSVAIGIAIQNKNRTVVCLDGDGAAIMHMGSMASISKLYLPKFIHIVLNNGEHESVGFQPSVGQIIDFNKIACGCGYNTLGRSITSKNELEEFIKVRKAENKPLFIDFRIRSGIRKDLKNIDSNTHYLIDIFKKTLNGGL